MNTAIMKPMNAARAEMPDTAIHVRGALQVLKETARTAWSAMCAVSKASLLAAQDEQGRRRRMRRL